MRSARWEYIGLQSPSPSPLLLPPLSAAACWLLPWEPMSIGRTPTERRLLSLQAKGKTGIICLGGGMIKHHIHNANLMRNGADFAVIVNTVRITFITSLM